MTEQEQANRIADAWLDGRMNALVQMVPGDPNCDACVLARQHVRLREAMTKIADPSLSWGHMKLLAREALGSNEMATFVIVDGGRR